jgi:hypothetical protein
LRHLSPQDFPQPFGDDFLLFLLGPKSTIFAPRRDFTSPCHIALPDGIISALAMRQYARRVLRAQR